MTTKEIETYNRSVDNSIIGLCAHNLRENLIVSNRGAVIVCEFEVSFNAWRGILGLEGELEYLPVHYKHIVEGMHIDGCRYFLDYSAYDHFLIAEEKDIRFVPMCEKIESEAEGFRLRPVYDPYSDSVELLIPQVSQAIVGYYVDEAGRCGNEAPQHHLVFGQISACRRHYGRVADLAVSLTWEVYREKENAGVALSTDEIAWMRVVELRKQQVFCDEILAWERKP